MTIADPTAYSGLVYWHTGDTLGLSDGSAIGTWNDSSSNASHATQATAGAKPLAKTGANGINGHDVARFDGVDDFLASAAPAATKPFTAFAVVRVTDFAASRPMVGASDVAALEWRCDQTTGLPEILSAGTASIGTGTGAPAAGVPAVLSATFGATGAYAFYLNGVAVGSGTNNVSFTARTLWIGGSMWLAEWFKGDIRQVGKYDSVLSTTQLDDLHRYLMADAGLGQSRGFALLGA